MPLYNVMGSHLCVILKFLQFVLASLSGWGLLIYGGLKAFGGKKEKKEEVCINLSFTALSLIFHMINNGDVIG